MKYCAFLLLFVALGCGREITVEDLKNLNGYWEIESATLPDGSLRDYKINETIDYIEIKGKTGFRKKVMPQFDGKYIDAGNPKEDFVVVFKEDKATLQYRTQYSQWEEELLEVTPGNLVVKNHTGIEFKYKRYKPLNLDEAHK